ncbi:MAG TPA: hypothetical protein IAB73_02755 [Candidatus Onthenecus intestinigallinarum]|uniref:DUF5655 domain-containing protein n=1 Tax=Candidatus Onthenecus intestinigallinarum TaxID=2840875 RepID=A0A9D0Z9L8_9FIRM|nr:hypothetical protein [Candidatus Onthenecus intestinigallinarum]
MSFDEIAFFNRMPQMLPLYAALREKLERAYPDMDVRVAKTQISFRNRHVFAMASLPWRRVKGWPEAYLLVSFGLPCRKESPRIAQAVEAYPNRWTHHVLVVAEDEIDDTLMSWLDEAFWFSAAK